MKPTVKLPFPSYVALALVLSTVPVMAAQEKPTTCYEGETKQELKSALGGHPDHGDSMGPCGPDADFQINTQFQAATGDSDFDDFLRNINIAAGSKLAVFISDLSVSYNVPEKDADFLIYSEKMQPTDVFMILQLVKISGKPFKEVITRFKTHRAKGWGAIALSCGVKPGSKAFLLLKEDIPPTIRKYEEVETTGLKGSKKKKHEKGSKKKGSKGKKDKKGSKKKGSKGKKDKKGSKKKGSKGKKDKKGSKGKKHKEDSQEH